MKNIVEALDGVVSIYNDSDITDDQAVEAIERVIAPLNQKQLAQTIWMLLFRIYFNNEHPGFPLR